MGSTYVHFTEEQKRKANAVDLVDFLRRQQEPLKKSGGEWRWLRHDSITVRGNRWYRHSKREGGYTIDFLQEFYGMTFQEAVTCLLGEEACQMEIENKEVTKEAGKFRLPEKNSTMRRIYGYLLNERFLNIGIVNWFVRAGTLYEEAQYHNAVFVGLDKEGTPRHAQKKGTCSQGSGYRSNEKDSDPHYGFGYVGKGEKIYVFEAAIDFLSFLTLYPDNWQEQSYITLNGVGEHALLQMLYDYPNLKEVIFCLDHDPPGIEACGRLAEIVCSRGKFRLSVLQSQNKDWNEDLKERHGKQTMPAQEHPKILACMECCTILQKILEVMDGRYEQPEIFRQYMEAFHSVISSDKKENVDEVEYALLHVICVSVKQVQRLCRMLEKEIAEEQVLKKLQKQYYPHRDKERLPAKIRKIQQCAEIILRTEKKLTEPCTEEKKKELIERQIRSFMELMHDGIGLHIFYACRQKEVLEKKMETEELSWKENL